MIIGVPKETRPHEHRVGLTPAAVARLTARGHEVLVEREAGRDAHFADERYHEAGARIVYTPEETYRRADLVCGVGRVGQEDLDLLRPGSTLCAFHHLAVANRRLVERLMELEVTLVGYEVIQDDEGGMPVLLPLSEMAGHLAVQTAAHYLQNEVGGRGILLGNVPGVPPPTVLILGAGAAGTAAAQQALAAGAHVILVDADLAKLRAANRLLGQRAVTAVVGASRLELFTGIADVVIGAVLVPGGRPPTLVSEDMVRAMKPGSVVVDLSIDQGGCLETSRPTTLGDPVYIVHDVVHCCVPNLTANIARTASRALADAAVPFVESLATFGLDEALRRNPALARGVYLHRGALVHRTLGEALELPAADLAGRLAPPAGSGEGSAR